MAISLCRSCYCMTKTNGVGRCGKCGADKSNMTNLNRKLDDKWMEGVIEAAEDCHKAECHGESDGIPCCPSGKPTLEYCDRDEEGNLVSDRCCGKGMCRYHCDGDCTNKTEDWLTDDIIESVRIYGWGLSDVMEEVMERIDLQAEVRGAERIVEAVNNCCCNCDCQFAAEAELNDIKNQ